MLQEDQIQEVRQSNGIRCKTRRRNRLGISPVELFCRQLEDSNRSKDDKTWQIKEHQQR